VVAKGVEDTAFYRYLPLVALNEVGGDPGWLGGTPIDVHRAMAERLRRAPRSLSATATHDTKRGEDARVRISALSEIPDEWRKAVAEWMRVNGRNRTKVQGTWAPDRNDEYLFYQALLGAWPAETALAPPPQRAADDLISRLTAYMGKAVREAKVHTSWIHENEDYGRAVAHFVTRTLSGPTAPRFLSSFAAFQQRAARVGMINSLAQLVLKLASPGVPDFYQGTELWDLSLVDPDNRRPVDFAHRRGLLAGLQPVIDRIEAGETAAREVRELLDTWPDGRIKLLVTACGLRFRRAHAELMVEGSYTALEPQGPAADHLVAFARRDRSGTLLAVVPRLVAPLVGDDRPVPLGREAWGSTSIVLPEGIDASTYRHLLTGDRVDVTAPHVQVASVFQTSPVALLWAPD
jgi:(1->4)-alpha-D-glucan 1-alpha-D-glucosylmutase